MRRITMNHFRKFRFITVTFITVAFLSFSGYSLQCFKIAKTPTQHGKLRITVLHVAASEFLLPAKERNHSAPLLPLAKQLKEKFSSAEVLKELPSASFRYTLGDGSDYLHTVQLERICKLQI
jgi:hypothetical protein